MGANGTGIHRGLLLLYSVAFLGWAASCAASMRLWFDELITVHLAMLPGLSRLREALEALADGIPPLYHLLVRGIFAVSGPSELAARLPSLLGVWAMTLCLYAFVARRCGPWYGWIALLVPLATPAAPFAYEARPYGLMLGLAGLVPLAWRAATEGGWRRVAGLSGMTLALASAVSSHYYAVLLFLPLALAEAARAVERRRLDPWPWLAMAAGAAPLIAFVPLARDLGAVHKATFFSKPQPYSLPEDYALLLAPLSPALVAVVLAFGWHCTRPPRTGPAPDAYAPPPWREYALGAGFLALPAFAFVLAVAVTGAWIHRYLLASCLGFGIVAAFVAHRLAEGRPGPARVAAFALLLAAVANLAADARHQSQRFRPPEALTDPLRLARDPTSPILVSSPDLYFQLVHYAPEVLRPRLFYVSEDRNTAQIHIDRLQPFAPVRFVGLRPFLAEHAPDGRFLLYGSTHDRLLPVLFALGARMEMHFIQGETILATVSGLSSAPDGTSPADPGLPTTGPSRSD